jgi:quinol monooxygenase YgiN
MIIITGSVTLRPEHLAEGVAQCIAHSARSRAEPGCVAPNCHIDCEDPNRVVFAEQWADMAAVVTHFAVPESRGFVAALRELADGEPEMAVWSAEQMR